MTRAQADEIVSGVKRLQRRHGDWISGDILAWTVARQTANFAAWNLEDGRQGNAGNRGSAKPDAATARSGRAPRRRKGAGNRGSAKPGLATAP